MFKILSLPEFFPDLTSGTGKVVPLGSGFGGIRNSPTEERGLEVSETGNYNEGKASLRSSLDVGQKSWKKIWPSQGRSRSVYVTSQGIAHLRRQAGDSGISDRNNEVNVEIPKWNSN